MKSSIIFAIFFALISLSLAERCTYSYCVKNELHECEESEGRIQCNQKDGLHIAYRNYLIHNAKYKCCIGWKIEDLSKKNLYCVIKVSDSKRRCKKYNRNGENESYDFKIATKCRDLIFACK